MLPMKTYHRRHFAIVLLMILIMGIGSDALERPIPTQDNDYQTEELLINSSSHPVGNNVIRGRVDSIGRRNSEFVFTFKVFQPFALKIFSDRYLFTRSDSRELLSILSSPLFIRHRQIVI